MRITTKITLALAINGLSFAAVSGMQETINNQSSHQIEVAYNVACSGAPATKQTRTVAAKDSTTIMVGDQCFIEASQGAKFEFKAVDDGAISAVASETWPTVYTIIDGEEDDASTIKL